MTHIKGPLLWTDATFDRFKEDKEGLILWLSDGTHRTMNYANWENSHPLTLINLKKLSKGQLIKFATWNGYNEDKWFCDVVSV